MNSLRADQHPAASSRAAACDLTGRGMLTSRRPRSRPGRPGLETVIAPIAANQTQLDDTS